MTNSWGYPGLTSCLGPPCLRSKRLTGRGLLRLWCFWGLLGPAGTLVVGSLQWSPNTIMAYNPCKAPSNCFGGVRLQRHKAQRATSACSGHLTMLRPPSEVLHLDHCLALQCFCLLSLLLVRHGLRLCSWAWVSSLFPLNVTFVVGFFCLPGPGSAGPAFFKLYTLVSEITPEI